MATDKYWESPYYNPNSMQMIYSGMGSSTENPYGIPKNDATFGQKANNAWGKFTGSGRQYGSSKTNPNSNVFGNGMFGANLFAPGTGSQLKTFTDKLMSPQFGWSAKSGLQGWGKNLGKWATGLGGLYYGLNALGGLKDYSDSKADTEELISDIVSASYNNPMLMYDLDSEQQKLLRQLRRGTFDTELDTDEMDLMGILGGTVTGGLTGALGGVPGIVVGALGGGANAYIDEMNRVQGLSTAELEALYEAVLASEQQNNAMKKQQMLQSGLYY